MLREALFDRIERAVHPFGATDNAPGGFITTLRSISQSTDPLFGSIDSCYARNAIMHKTLMSLSMVYTETVLFHNGRYYYGIFCAESLSGGILDSWQCVRRVNIGDKLWETLKGLAPWKTSKLADITISQMLKELTDETGGSFEDDPVWQSVRANESGTYVTP